MKRKHLLIIFLTCSLLISICVLWAENDDNTGRSAIKIFREDNSDIKRYKVYDGERYIGKLNIDGYLLWTRQAGEAKIKLEQCFAFPTIEMITESNTMYEIVLMDDRYATAIYEIEIDEIKEQPWYFIYIFAGIVILAIVLPVLIWRKIFRDIKVKQLISSGTISLENNDFEKAIFVLTKAVKVRKKNPEAWQQLEKAYRRIGNYENAELCKKKAIGLLTGTKINRTSAELPEVNIDRYELIKALNEKGLNVDNINIVRNLDSGYSGAKVILTEILIKDRNTVNFGVIKIDPGKSENELFREAEGYKALSASWNDIVTKHIPQNSIFIKSSKILSGKQEMNLLLSSFADEKNTKNVVTLREGLQNNFRKYLPCFLDIKSFYEAQFNKISNNKFLTVSEHLKNILAFKFDKIMDFPWNDFGIPTDKKFVNIGGKLYPNIIHYLGDDKMWNSDGFSCKYSTIHGDLNLDNIIIKSDMNFVLIDFEKTRESVFLYDLAFMISWIMQIFVSEAYQNQNNENLIDFSEQIISFIKNPKSTLGSPAFAENSVKILKEVYPFEKDFEQNSLKAFMLSLLSATILRAFYELRDSKKKRSKQNKQNGVFFYSFACMLADNPDFVKRGKIAAKDAFDLY